MKFLNYIISDEFKPIEDIIEDIQCVIENKYGSGGHFLDAVVNSDLGTVCILADANNKQRIFMIGRFVAIYINRRIRESYFNQVVE